MADTALAQWLDQVTRKHKLGTETGPPPAAEVAPRGRGNRITADSRQVILDDLKQLDGLLQEAKRTG